MTAWDVDFAGAKAFRDDRSQVVGHQLVESAIAVREVRGRQVDDHLCVGRDLVNDLEIEDGLPAIELRALEDQLE